MRIAVFGSTGRTGRLLCEGALERGHDVRAHARSSERIADIDQRIERVVGDLADPATIREAVWGAQIVLCALGTVDRKRNTVLSDATRAILDAMKEAGAGHFAAITSLGCGDSYAQVNSRMMRFAIRTLAKEIWADKDRQGAVIRASAIDHLIVRPGGLTDGEATGEWHELRDGERSAGKQMIARADVADHILARCEALPFGDDVVTLV